MEEKRIKPLEEMCLMDRFLFAEYASRKENLELLLQIILGDDNLHLTDDVQAEREFRITPDRKQIRLDVFGSDELGSVYDVEPQKRSSDSIEKRSRYYQGILDSNLLPAGEDYKKLPDSYIIFVCDFDLFGKGLYVYTFTAMCHEEAFPLEDGAVRIFINTKGTRRTEAVSEELMELLQLFDRKQAMSSPKLRFTKVRDIHNRVEKIKKDKEVSMRYFMMLDEKKEYADEVTKELQEEISILHDRNSMLQDTNSMLQDTNSMLQDTNSMLQDTNSMLQDTNSMLQDKLDETAADHIQTIFEMCQELQLGKAETIRRLETKAHMSHQAADDYVNEHWN